MEKFKKLDVLLETVLHLEEEIGESMGEAIYLDENEDVMLIFLSDECALEKEIYLEMIKDINLDAVLLNTYKDTENFDLNDCLVHLDKIDGKLFTCLGYEVELILKP